MQKTLRAVNHLADSPLVDGSGNHADFSAVPLDVNSGFSAWYSCFAPLDTAQLLNVCYSQRTGSI